MDALTWASMATGFEEGRQRNNKMRLEAAKVFNEFKKQNPDATFQDYQTFISAVSGSAPWVRDALPNDQQLQGYADFNAQQKALAERQQRMETMTRQAQLAGVFEQNMVGNLLGTNGDTQQALERTIKAMSGGDETLASDLRAQYGNNNYADLWQRTQSDVMDKRWDQVIQLGETGQQITSGSLQGILGFTPTAQQVELANLRVKQALEAKQQRNAQLARERQNSDLQAVLQVMNFSKSNVMPLLQRGDKDGAKRYLGSLANVIPGVDPKLFDGVVTNALDGWAVQADDTNRETWAKFTTSNEGPLWASKQIKAGASVEQMQAGLAAQGIIVDTEQVKSLIESTRAQMQAAQEQTYTTLADANTAEVVKTLTGDQKKVDDVVATTLNGLAGESEAAGVGEYARGYYFETQQQADEFVKRVKDDMPENVEDRAKVVDKVAKEMNLKTDDEVMLGLKSGGHRAPMDGVSWSNQQRAALDDEAAKLSREMAEISKLPLAEIPLARVGQIKQQLAALNKKGVKFMEETKSYARNMNEWDNTFSLEANIRKQGDSHPFMANPMAAVKQLDALNSQLATLEAKASKVDKVLKGTIPITELSKDPAEQMKIIQQSQREKLTGLYQAGNPGRLTMDEAAKLSLILGGTRSLSIPNTPDYAGSIARLRQLENAYVRMSQASYSDGYGGGASDSVMNDVLEVLRQELAKYK